MVEILEMMEYPEYEEDFQTLFARPMQALGFNQMLDPDGHRLLQNEHCIVITTYDKSGFNTLIHYPDEQRPVLCWDAARFLMPEANIPWGGFTVAPGATVREHTQTMMKTQLSWYQTGLKPAVSGDRSWQAGYNQYVLKRAHYYKYLSTQLPADHELLKSWTEADYFEKAEAWMRENGVDPASIFQG